MGNFEKLSVLVIVVIIVMILVVALYTWTGDPSGTDTAAANVVSERVEAPKPGPVQLDPKKVEAKDPKKDEKNGGSRGVMSAEDIRRMLIGGAGMDAVDPKVDAKTEGKGDVAGGKGSDESGAVADDTKPVVKEPRFHVVVDGETIGRIAKAEYPGVGQRAIDAILKANPTVDPARMAIRTKLLLPELAVDSKAADGAKKASPVAPQGGETAVASIKPGSVYVTKKGDSLKNLAQRAYRDANQWHHIWVENFDAISDHEHLQGGLKLKIPVL